MRRPGFNTHIIYTINIVNIIYNIFIILNKYIIDFKRSIKGDYQLGRRNKSYSKDLH